MHGDDRIILISITILLISVIVMVIIIITNILSIAIRRILCILRESWACMSNLCTASDHISIFQTEAHSDESLKHCKGVWVVSFISAFMYLVYHIIAPSFITSLTSCWIGLACMSLIRMYPMLQV